MTDLILKRASASRPSGEWKTTTTTCWPMALSSVTSCAQPRHPRETLAFGHHEDRTPTHGHEPTREAAVAVLMKRAAYVRYRGQPGNHLLVLSFTGFDPHQTCDRAVGAKIVPRDNARGNEITMALKKPAQPP
jgi:hypothetical protein